MNLTLSSPPVRPGQRSRRMNLVLRGSMARLLALVVFALALLVIACSKPSTASTRYHCPMHPTYIADTQGDCPICGMRLVAIDPAKTLAPSSSPRANVLPSGSASAGARLWTCPMDPEVVSDKPSRCPKCGMDLERQADRIPGRVPVDIDADGLRLAGVRLATAERGALSRTIRTVGTVVPDETRVRHVHTKVSGWVEKLQVDFTGQAVTKGRPILTLYSQELLAVQQEYLRAREASMKASASTIPEVRQAAQEMLDATRRRLGLLDIPPGFIQQLDRTGEPQRSVTISAPVSGIVTSKSIFEGQQVDPGMELFTVTDLSRIWIEAEVYENEASAVKVGQDATLTLAYSPGVQLTGKVAFIYPYLNAQTRTLKVRFEFPNKDLALKLQMYVNVEMPIQASEGILVPESAVMDTGTRQVVFVSPKEGRFDPRRVRVGVRADGKAEILEGLEAGEKVVVKANFLIDSESRLRSAVSDSEPIAPTPEGAK